MRPRLTHLALGVRHLDRTIAFYRKHVHLHVVHERAEDGRRVVWLAEQEADADFVLVLFEVPREGPPGPQNLQHLGFAVASRNEVDQAAAAAREIRSIRTISSHAQTMRRVETLRARSPPWPGTSRHYGLTV